MSLLHTTAKGVAWTTASTVVRSVVSLLQVAILTRFLDKSDFGIVAIATVFLGFTQIFLDLGISAGIMHKQDTTPQQYSSLFWLNIFMGVLLTGVLCACSPLVAKAYKEPCLTKIISLLSFTIFFSSLGSQHRTVQQKKMRFKYISIIEITTSLLSLVLAVLLAYFGFGVYSLVYSNLFHVASSSLLFLGIGLSKDRNISFHFKLSETYDYLKIGVFSIGSHVLDYFSREMDILIISATLGKEVTGLYSLCKKLVMAMYATVNPILTKVITPIFALIQKEKERVLQLYYDIIESLAILNMPIYCLIAIFSVGILKYLYGDQYTDGALILAFTALTYGINTTGSPVGSLQIAMGRTDSGFYWTICRIVATAIAIYVGSQFSINAIALSLLILNIVVNPAFWRVTIKPIIGGHYKDYFANSVFICLIIMLFSFPVYLLCNKWTSVPLCLLTGFFYIVVFFIIVYRFFSKVYLIRLFKERIQPWLKSRVRSKKVRN
jgi:teichuronic acid exporter